MLRRTALIFIPLACAMAAYAIARESRSGDAMFQSAQRFLDSLTPDQRSQAVLPFDSEEREHWNYVPLVRKGVPLKRLSEEQRKLAMAFLRAGVSQKGYLKAATIMSLEDVLREIEGGQGPTRDPELYYFTVFGTPSAKETWGWRVEGHHISLNFTVVKGSLIATTPQFLGANPAEVRSGPKKGLRALSAEEDLARDLLHALDEKQRAQAIFNTVAPGDIITTNSRKADLLEPKGVEYSEMTPEQRKKLTALIDEYARAMPEELAAERLERLKKAGLSTIRFAWAGGTERGEPHYYRVQGPTFLIEYDNTQNDANHIHSVWRDFNGDWGADLLQDHYLYGHHSHDHGTEAKG
jgi:hypothetical protein